VNMSGTNDVVVSSGTAKSFDASSVVGKVTYTQAGDVVTTVKGGSDTATVVFAGTTVNSTFNGLDGNSSLTFVNTTGTATATGGSGNDVVSATGILVGAGTLDVSLGDGTNSATANNATTGTINYVGGSGADTLSATGITTGTVSADTGAGDDSITLGAGLTSGVVSASTGAGDDTVTIGASTVTGTFVFAGGAGTDTLSVANGTSFAGANLTMTDVEVIQIASGGTATFDQSDLSGASMTIKGANNSEVLAVTTAATTGATIDLSGLTMDATLAKAISATTITGGSGADTITGTTGADTINGGAKADTIVFASSATLNGTDVLTYIEGTDVLNFNAFLGGGTVDQNGGVGTAITSYSSSATADAAIAGKVVALADATDGTVVTAVDGTADIISAIDSTGNEFSITAGGKAVIIAGSAAGTQLGHVYYVHDKNSDGDVADSGEVAKVATLTDGTNGFDIDLITSTTLIA